LGKKQPYAKKLPHPGKTPRGVVPDSEEKRPVWRFQIVDFEGPFGWLECKPRVKLRDVIQKLGNFESMKWHEIEGSQSHFISVESLSKPAQDRLLEIGQEDIDQVFSLRLMGAERVIGIRDRWILKLLWWDPNHEVCPSKLKHT
jgi:hypothetical protein